MRNHSENENYGINNLISTWNTGWKEFAKIAPPFQFWGFHHGSRPTGSAIKGLEELLGCVLGMSHREDILSLYSNDNPVYRDGFIWRTEGTSINASCDLGGFLLGRLSYICCPEEKTPLADNPEFIRRVIDAFDTTQTFSEALSKVLGKDGLTKITKGKDKDKDALLLNILENTVISSHAKKIIKLFGKAIDNTEVTEEAWWNTVWFAIEETVHKFIEIEEKIENDIPLETDETDIINEIIAYGQPKVCTVIGDDGKETKAIKLEPFGNLIGSGLESGIESMGTMLLVQPAFVISKSLEEKNKEPRFVRVCRAPACGKRFYTGRKNATACPGNQGKKKSECALGWVRYKRWLEKISVNPEKKWDDPKLIKQYFDSGNS